MLRLLRAVCFIGLAAFLFSSFAQETIKDFYLSNYKENGSKDWEVKGSSAVVYNDKIDIVDTDGRFFASNDTISFMSRSAVLNKTTLDVDLRDSVHIENLQGVTLDTDYLLWKKNENIIETQAPVKLCGYGVEINATGMSGQTDLQKVLFLKDVKADIIDKKTQKPVVVVCEGHLNVEYQSQKAVFNKRVVISGQEGRVYGDRATAFFDRINKKITKVVCKGNTVKIMKEDSVTFAKNAVYLAAENRLVTGGNPRIMYFPKKKEKTAVLPPVQGKKTK